MCKTMGFAYLEEWCRSGYQSLDRVFSGLGGRCRLELGIAKRGKGEREQKPGFMGGWLEKLRIIGGLDYV